VPEMVSFEMIENLIQNEAAQKLESLLLSVDTSVAHWPKVIIPASAAFYCKQGQAVQIAHAPTSGWVSLYASDDTFLGIGEIMHDGRIAPRRLVQ